MPVVIETPAVIQAVGEREKIIEEYFGRVRSGNDAISIAKMTSEQGWEEPGQTPEFDEYTLLLKGRLKVETADSVVELKAGQAMLTKAGEWVRYSTPFEGGAEYVAVCLPAFSPASVHRDG